MAQIDVLDAAAIVFEDGLIRSGESHWEFEALAESYRSELWPHENDARQNLGVRLRHLRVAKERVSAALAALETTV